MRKSGFYISCVIIPFIESIPVRYTYLHCKQSTGFCNNGQFLMPFGREFVFCACTFFDKTGSGANGAIGCLSPVFLCLLLAYELIGIFIYIFSFAHSVNENIIKYQMSIERNLN